MSAKLSFPHYNPDNLGIESYFHFLSLSSLDKSSTPNSIPTTKYEIFFYHMYWNQPQKPYNLAISSYCSYFFAVLA